LAPLFCGVLVGVSLVATVLIIEDDTQVRVLAESIFQDAGYTTLSAGTLTEAHAILQSDQPIDLVFTDMTLVDEQEAGLQIGQSAAQARAGVPVIYTTARGVTDGMRALFVEPHRFVPKPWTPDQVLTAATELLSKA
jgi:DNA-binding NtrC family response regulator